VAERPDDRGCTLLMPAAEFSSVGFMLQLFADRDGQTPVDTVYA